MTEIIGRQIDLGIGREESRGVAVPPQNWLPAMVKNVEDKADLVMDEAGRGVIEAPHDAKVAGRNSEGDVEFILRDLAIGFLLLNVYGSVDTDADSPEAGVNTHDFSVDQSVSHPSLTLAMKHANQGLRFALAMVKTLEMDVKQGDFIRVKAGFLAKKGGSASDTPDYSVEEHQFIAQHCNVYLADDLAGLETADPILLRSAKLKFDKNVELDRVVGSVEPNDIFNRSFNVNGSVELLYRDTDLKDLAMEATPKAMRIELIHDETIGTTSKPTLVFDFAKVVLKNFARTSEPNDFVRQTLDFDAMYSQEDEVMTTAQLINTQDSYDAVGGS